MKLKILSLIICFNLISGAIADHIYLFNFFGKTFNINNHALAQITINATQPICNEQMRSNYYSGKNYNYPGIYGGNGIVGEPTFLKIGDTCSEAIWTCRYIDFPLITNSDDVLYDNVGSCPTPSPTPSPTPAPTPSPTPNPTPAPTPAPTPTPSPKQYQPCEYYSGGKACQYTADTDSSTCGVDTGFINLGYPGADVLGNVCFNPGTDPEPDPCSSGGCPSPTPAPTTTPEPECDICEKFTECNLKIDSLRESLLAKLDELINAINSISINNSTVNISSSFNTSLTGILAGFFTNLQANLTANFNLTINAINSFKAEFNTKIAEVISAINGINFDIDLTAVINAINNNFNSLFSKIDQIKLSVDEIKLAIESNNIVDISPNFNTVLTGILTGFFANLEANLTANFNLIISAINNFKTQFIFSTNEVRDAIRDFNIDLSPVVDSIVDLDDNFTVTMNDLDNQLNLLFQNLKSYIVTELLNIKAELINIQSLINFDLIIAKLDEIKLAIEQIDLQVDFSTIITTINGFKSDMIFKLDLALTELSNIKTELINIKSLINFDLIIVKLNEIKLAVEGINLQVNTPNLTINFSPVVTAINKFESAMIAKLYNFEYLEYLFDIIYYLMIPDIRTIDNNLTNIQLILNNNFALILQSFNDLKLELDLINQKLDLIFQKLENLNIDFLPITTKLNEIKLELNLTNIWAERIYDLLKAKCVGFDPGLSLDEYNNLPPLPIGANYCPFDPVDPEEPPPEEELTQCPIDLWEKPPFPMYLMNEAIHRFPLDLVAGTPWPAPTPAADNNIEFFAQKININWLITGIDFLKYPALVSFLIWVIVAL
jgi:hypothetical protein